MYPQCAVVLVVTSLTSSGDTGSSFAFVLFSCVPRAVLYPLQTPPFEKSSEIFNRFNQRIHNSRVCRNQRVRLAVGPVAILLELMPRRHSEILLDFRV